MTLRYYTCIYILEFLSAFSVCVCVFMYMYVQNLVSSLERSRAAMANDLAAVSVQNVELTEKVDIIPQLNTKLQVHRESVHGPQR